MMLTGLRQSQIRLPFLEDVPLTSALVITERERCRAIIESIEARGRYERARQLAFQTDLSAETSIIVLATEK